MTSAEDISDATFKRLVLQKLGCLEDQMTSFNTKFDNLEAITKDHAGDIKTLKDCTSDQQQEINKLQNKVYNNKPRLH